MSFKDILSRALATPLFSREEQFVFFFGRSNFKEQFFELYFEFESVVKRMLLSRALDALLFDGAEPLCYSGREHHEKKFCELF